MSVKGDRTYWHVQIFEASGKLLLALTGEKKVDITEYLLSGTVK